jgi:3D (Asp-Asp-Asp) domain-containing protein
MPRSQTIPNFFLKIGANILIFSVLISLMGILLFFRLKTSAVKADFEVLDSQNLEISQLPIVQKNSFSSVNNPFPTEQSLITLEKIPVVVTGYSSTVKETDSTPYITAAGSQVKDGIVANNLLPFGTKIRLPEIYGDKVFVVEDRMNARKDDYHVDVWFSSHEEAENFGAKTTYIEILGS